MKKKTKLGLGMALALTLGTAGTVANKNADLYDKTIPITLDSGKTIKVPVYNIFTGLRPNLCSAYVRKASAEIFGENYSFSDAWNKRYEDRLVAPVNKQSIESLVEKGILQPGMALTVTTPDSEYSNGSDKKGNPRTCNHIMLFLGQKNGKPLFAHQYGAKTHVETEETAQQKGIIFREIIDSSK
jgi:hypothetical protein